jgi:hypothetical protein
MKCVKQVMIVMMVLILVILIVINNQYSDSALQSKDEISR